MLRDLGARLASSQTTNDVLASARQSLAFGERNLPFTLTWLVEGPGRGAGACRRDERPRRA